VPQDGKILAPLDFRPCTKHVRRETEVNVPVCRAIDAHNHLGLLGPAFGDDWQNCPVAAPIDQLDRAHVGTYVDLDGGWDEDTLDSRLRKFKNAAPERFIFFGGPGWKYWADHGNAFGERAAKGFAA
jgi:hypothetical protein